MANLYWNAPSSPAYYTDAANWRVGSTSGPVSSTAPTSTDVIWFSSSSSTVGCTFDSNVSVASFYADDPSGSFILGPGFTDSFQITFTSTFNVQDAGSLQKAIFSQWSSLYNAPVVTVLSSPSSGGSASVDIGPTQMGKISIAGSTTATTYFTAAQGITRYPFKCYVLQIDSGTASFNVTECNGAYLGNPSITTPYNAINMSVVQNLYRKLDAQFDSSKPIILYNGMTSQSSPAITYDLVWASDTRIYVKGASSRVTLNVAPIPAGFGAPATARKLPYVYNYLGEDASGSAVSSGGVLVFDAIYAGASSFTQVYAQGVICTAAGSVSGFFNRGLEISSDYPSIRYTQLEIPGTGSTNTSVFNLTGAPSYQVTLTNSAGVPPGSSYRGRFSFYNTVTPNVTTSYATISGIEASSMFGGGQYLAYTVNGNIDGGNNSGWIFTQSQSGFLAFFS